MSEDMVRNVMTNPWGLLRSGQAARTADLRAELADLRGRAGCRSWPCPATATASSGTRRSRRCARRWAPRAGSCGGPHSWLLTNPDVFGEVLGNVLDVQDADRDLTIDADTALEIGRLLARTEVPADLVDRLLAEASPLWLMSETAAVLAGDLALCHPALSPGEVRAVARAVEGSTALRLTVVAEDRPGLLADTAAVLASEGLSVTSASAVTSGARSTRRIALHALTFSGGSRFDPDRWSSLGVQLRSLGSAATPPCTLSPAGRAPVTRTARRRGERSWTVAAPGPGRAAVGDLPLVRGPRRQHRDGERRARQAARPPTTSSWSGLRPRRAGAPTSRPGSRAARHHARW